MNASTLKYGVKVMYHSTTAIVQRVASNGVYISYEGKGIKAGEYITEKVSAKYLTLA